MDNLERIPITVQTAVNAHIEKVWQLWTLPEHVINWNHASDDWHSPRAENDLREGGSFSYRMEAKDGSFGFDFGGVYDTVKPNELIEYSLGDGRKVRIEFIGIGNSSKIVETFEAEKENPVEMQRSGWQAIMNNFKKYAETLQY